MTHPAYTHIVKAPAPLQPKERRPFTWDQVCEVARQILAYDAKRRSPSTAEIQAIRRADALLSELKAQRKIRNFTMGEMAGGVLDIQVTVPDELYFRKHNLTLREQVAAVLADLPVRADVSITPDVSDVLTPQPLE